MNISIRIPRPSDSTTDCRSIAEFSSPLGAIYVYWWAPHRTVLIHKISNDEWYAQNDGTIRQSLADILRADPDGIYVENLIRHRGLVHSDGWTHLSEKDMDQFLDCEWSDYACDHRLVCGNVFERTSPSVETEDGRTMIRPLWPQE